MRYVFASHFGAAMGSLVVEKQALGFSYRSGQYRLEEFDRFCCQEFPMETRLTQTLVQRWAELRPGEHPNNRGERLTYVRQLADYLRAMGEDAFALPPGMGGRRIRYLPHIFTRSELDAFFGAADGQSVTPFSPTRHLVVPVLFRLLYACGLRPAEAAHLDIGDVDWSRGLLYIRQSKGRKDRLVPMAADMWARCRAFDEAMRILLPHRSALFPNRYGHRLHPATFDDWFHELWDAADLGPVAGNAPRLYDLRHTFCVHRLNQWVREGRDVQTLLPYLSGYLGHTSLAMTDYYLHLVPDFYPDIQRLSQPGAALIPEVRT